MYLIYCEPPGESAIASDFETIEAARDYIHKSIKQCYASGYVNGGSYRIYRNERVPVLCPHCDGRLEDEYRDVFVEKIEG